MESGGFVFPVKRKKRNNIIVLVEYLYALMTMLFILNDCFSAVVIEQKMVHYGRGKSNQHLRLKADFYANWLYMNCRICHGV